MSRVKFNARMEYEYLDNFKILQKAFTRHKIEKVGLVVAPFFFDMLTMCVILKAYTGGQAHQVCGWGFVSPLVYTTV